jgi:uncharacterized membrane protein
MLKKLLFIIIVALALFTGLLFPSIYLFVEEKYTFLNSKIPEVTNNLIWKISFICHISFGGLSLIIGWIQFVEKLRKKSSILHRKIGKLYILSVIISSVTAIYIGFFANGGLISAFGFICLGILWFTTTIIALIAIKNGHIKKHQNFMTYSYACTFAAVTLRLWIPLLNGLLKSPELTYLIVAWLCWIPNIIVAYFINKNRIIIQQNQIQ